MQKTIGALGLVFGFLAVLYLACTPAQTVAATKIGVTVGADVCKELATQPEPEWVVLACAVEAVAGTVLEGGLAATVQVRIPRAQWMAIKSPIARTFDASPGK